MGNVISRNIKVSNDPSKPLYVSFETSGDVINEYAESLSLAGLATTTIITYTVPIGKRFKLLRSDYSGGNRAIYTLDINGSPASVNRAYYTNFNGEFEMGGLDLVAGDIIKIIVENKTNMIADFNANIIGVLDDA